MSTIGRLHCIVLFLAKTYSSSPLLIFLRTGHVPILEADPVLLVALLFKKGGTPAAPVAVRHQDGDVDAPTPGPVPVPDQGPIPVLDSIGDTHDRGVALTPLTLEGEVDAALEGGRAADHRCPIGRDIREIGSVSECVCVCVCVCV